jgi:colanic acid biosynthesis glycosyl transferase WcaI
VGITLGVFRNQAVIGLVSWLERFCLDHAKVVRILSESFRSDLRKMGVPEAKMALVYDWVDTDLIRPLPRKNNFSQEHRLDEKCVLMYAGNIGLSQGLEHILTAAELLKAETDICFVLVGDGKNREPLMEEAERRGLENVKFIPFQPRERLAEVLATADMALVPLQKGIGASSLPSKTYSILASGRPVIASIDEHCEGWNLIEQAGAGVCVPPENPIAIAEAVIKLKENKELRTQMGKRGREWAERNHSPQSAARKIEHILAGIAAA